MIQATLMMAFRVRGFRSFLQNSRRRRRRCVACKWSIVTTSFLLAPAHHPQRMTLTEGPLQQKTETDDYTLCLDPIEVLSIGSASPRSGPRASPRGGLRPLCGETVEGLTPPRFGRTKTECEELIPLSTRVVDGGLANPFQGKSSLLANFFGWTLFAVYGQELTARGLVLRKVLLKSVRAGPEPVPWDCAAHAPSLATYL